MEELKLSKNYPIGDTKYIVMWCMLVMVEGRRMQVEIML
jgi:hypothetical protein